MIHQHRLISEMLCFAVLFMLGGCISFSQVGESANRSLASFEQQDFDSATYFAAHAVRLEPADLALRNQLEVSYQAAIQSHLSQIKLMQGRVDLASVSATLEQYQKIAELNSLMSALSKLVNVFIDISGNTFADEVLQAKKQFAEVHYQQGQLFGRLLGRDNQILAAQHFQLAAEQLVDYKDSQALYTKYKLMATRRVAVLPYAVDLPNHPWANAGDLVVQQLATELASDFLVVVAMAELQSAMTKLNLPLNTVVSQDQAVILGQAVAADYVITGTITRIKSSPANLSEKVEQVKTFDGIRRMVYVDAEGQQNTAIGPAYLEANISEFNIDTHAEIAGHYALIEVKSDKLVMKDALVAAEHYSYSWLTLNDGNKLALSFDQRRSLTKAVRPVPLEFFMVKNAAVKLANSMSAQLNNHSIYQ